jgi:hypothetical protein
VTLDTINYETTYAAAVKNGGKNMQNALKNRLSEKMLLISDFDNYMPGNNPLIRLDNHHN